MGACDVPHRPLSKSEGINAPRCWVLLIDILLSCQLPSDISSVEKSHPAQGHASCLGEFTDQYWDIRLSPSSYFRTTLKGCSRSWAPCGVAWDLHWDCFTTELHLPNSASFLSVSHILTPEESPANLLHIHIYLRVFFP